MSFEFGDLVTCTKANLIGFKKRGVITSVSDVEGYPRYNIKWPAFAKPIGGYRRTEIELLVNQRMLAQEAAEYDYITNLPRPE